MHRKREIGGRCLTSESWDYRPLAELTENFDFKRVPVKGADRRPGPYPYYGASGVVDHVDGYLFEGEYLLIAEDGENLRTRTTPIAFTAKGRFWVNNHAHIVRGNDLANTQFLMYALAKIDISGYLTGSTMPKLTQGHMNRIPILAPSRDEQDKIVAILGSLDDKIDLNRRMNETLEAMAGALFRSWFVDFDPVRAKQEGRQPPGLDAATAALFPDSFDDSPLGSIPRGWQVKEFAEIVDVIDCLHTRKPDRSASGLPLLQLWNIRDDGLLDMAETYFIDKDAYKLWTSRIEASLGDCVITNVGRVGAVAQIPAEMKAALGRNMTGIRCKSSFSFPTFLIQCLLSDALREEIERNKDTGTILDALNVRNIPRLRFTKPTSSLLKQFEQVVRPLRAKMEQNLQESQTLAALRDALLPKLLSGELRVRSEEPTVEAVS